MRINASNGDIIVGSKTYPGRSPGFHVLALSRQPNRTTLDSPDLVLDGTYTDAPNALAALQTILTRVPDAFLIVNAVGNYGFTLADQAGVVSGKMVTVASTLRSFGAYEDLGPITSPIPFVFVGSGGMNERTALERGYRTLDLTGYLAPDSNGNYAFIRTDFARYDLQLNGDITVGKTTYTVASSYKPGCSGDASNSFHLVVVDRETLDLAANNTYCTAQSDSEIARLVGDLDTVTSGFTNESALVFFGEQWQADPGQQGLRHKRRFPHLSSGSESRSAGRIF